MARKHIFIILALFGFFLNALANQDAANLESRWENTIREFEDWDKKNSFPADSVLFAGSSSIRGWETNIYFKDFPVINRGFGGSQISDINYFADRMVLPYKPKIIVFYAGDNDVAAGKTPQIILNDYKKFVSIVHKELPETKIIFISIKPSSSRWSMWVTMKEANNLIEQYSQSNPNLIYFDGAGPLLNSEGKPDDNLFKSDKLHLNEKGYEIWTKLLNPIIVHSLKG